MSAPQLPPNLLFGTATAAYQVEGAATEGGRGPSIWDTYCRTPGRVARGESGDVACDHYHRYAEDVDLIAGLGVDLYRFSVSWPRVQPDGRGAPNPEGLAFYDRLVDTLLDAGVEPALTLYHWDLPQALEDEGGWRVRDTAHRFAEYARIVADHLGDRVDRWITLNEPFCSAFVGHAVGRHAPGTREGAGALAAAHHLLLAHGQAVGELRGAGAGEVGITLNPDHLVPATDSEADRAAVERVRTLHNRTWFDPLFTGAYPDNEREVWGALADAPHRREGDLETIGRPLDFLGVNFYRPLMFRDAPHAEPDPALRTAVDVGAEQVEYTGSWRHTTMGWPVVPETFEELLVDLNRRYPGLPPILITENGSAEPDAPDDDGRVHDTDRVAYLREHLAALGRAIEAGVDVRGYFVWSLLDNFEWAYGYERRFGLVRVDYQSLERHPKDSYHWYREYLAAHRARRG
ncbi:MULTISPECIES: GH1 family beta-glucosidase [Nocardiopsis]|uniref:GH1 family beta-glucosidase n=1 Tax=Nocardiopsis TaxID=2013 RepID=UPI000348492E|nr:MULTISPECIES: GH1 family beta-glucosidase [Nocardiopsis]PWV55443.1 broad-specificity cellobiase [Nocardiopsis sp. L17-MgMaSL7]